MKGVWHLGYPQIPMSSHIDSDHATNAPAWYVNFKQLGRKSCTSIDKGTKKGLNLGNENALYFFQFLKHHLYMYLSFLWSFLNQLGMFGVVNLRNGLVGECGRSWCIWSGSWLMHPNLASLTMMILVDSLGYFQQRLLITPLLVCQTMFCKIWSQRKWRTNLGLKQSVSKSLERTEWKSQQRSNRRFQKRQSSTWTAATLYVRNSKGYNKVLGRSKIKATHSLILVKYPNPCLDTIVKRRVHLLHIYTQNVFSYKHIWFHQM